MISGLEMVGFVRIDVKHKHNSAVETRIHWVSLPPFHNYATPWMTKGNRKGAYKGLVGRVLSDLQENGVDFHTLNVEAKLIKIGIYTSYQDAVDNTISLPTI